MRLVRLLLQLCCHQHGVEAAISRVRVDQGLHDDAAWRNTHNLEQIWRQARSVRQVLGEVVVEGNALRRLWLSCGTEIQSEFERHFDGFDKHRRNATRVLD